MPQSPDATLLQKLAAFPLATFQPGEVVLAEGSKTGRLWILREGAVAVVRRGVEIARVMESGAVFGELSALLDMPHTADVRALEFSLLHVADSACLRQDPALLLYVATILARRLNGANHALVDLDGKIQLWKTEQLIGRI
jgi:CRP/FNR family cyclic AMP-dependent transcriptional regulator